MELLDSNFDKSNLHCDKKEEEYELDKDSLNEEEENFEIKDTNNNNNNNNQDTNNVTRSEIVGLEDKLKEMSCMEVATDFAMKKPNQNNFANFIILDHKVEESVVDDDLDDAKKVEIINLADSSHTSSTSLSSDSRFSPSLAVDDAEKSSSVKEIVNKLEKALGSKSTETKREKCVVLENIHSQENESNDFEDLGKTVLTRPQQQQEQEDPQPAATVDYSTTTLIKRTHLKNLIFELYDLEEEERRVGAKEEKDGGKPVVLIEGFVDKLPPGRNLKNSILLAWKRRFFSLNSIGVLYVYDINERGEARLNEPIEAFHLMGGRAAFEQSRVISLDDCKGNCLVFRVSEANEEEEKSLFQKWKEAIDAQIIDRSDSLWVRPDRPITSDNSLATKKLSNKKILIVEIGTCSIRAGFFNIELGFEAFDSLLASSAPSTIDLKRAVSLWSLSPNSPNQLIFPLKNKNAIDKLNMDMESIDSIIAYIVDSLNISCPDYQIVLITPQKFSDRVNVQFLNLLLQDERYQFASAMLINQSVMTLYSYNSVAGVIVNLGEKIDIVPILNGVAFQNGVTNLAYGGSTMSEYLNSFISRGHVSYVNHMEQFFIRYIKERTCYAAINYKEECAKFSSDNVKHTIELSGQHNEFKKVEFPESARFRTVEGLFNPEIWGIDGQGIHKLVHRAIQSCSMDLRREMARSVYLCGGMSRIPGVRERLEKELKQLLPPTLTVKVNCSEYSYHSAYLGAFKFVQQPEYEKLLITRDEWIKENVNCLRKWRMI